MFYAWCWRWCMLVTRLHIWLCCWIYWLVQCNQQVLMYLDIYCARFSHNNLWSFLWLLFEHVTAAQQKITIIEPQMYKQSLSSCKCAAKCCLQNGKGLAEYCQLMQIYSDSRCVGALATRLFLPSGLILSRFPWWVPMEYEWVRKHDDCFLML